VAAPLFDCVFRVLFAVQELAVPLKSLLLKSTVQLCAPALLPRLRLL